MIAESLKRSILSAAIQGKLTDRNKEDSVSDLLERIAMDRNELIKKKIIKAVSIVHDIPAEERPFEIPIQWEFVKMDSIAFVTKLAGFEYTSHISENKQSFGIPLFKGKNVQNGKLVFEYEDYISEEISNLLIRSQLNRKCLLTPYVGTIGNIALFDGSFKAHLGSNVGKIELLNHLNLNILEEYVLYYLRSPEGLIELKKNKKSTAQESISIQDIRDVKIPIPSLAEQKRIVEKLDEILPLIDSLEKDEIKLKDLMQKFPEKMKLSTLQAAIQGKISHQITDKENTLLEFSKENDFYPTNAIEDIPFDIPENWAWAKMSTLIKLGNGTKMSDMDYKYLDVKFLRGKSNEEFRSTGRYIKSGTKIILVDGENSGEVFIAPEDGYMGSTFRTLELKYDHIWEYLKLFLDLHKSTFRNNKTGSAIPHLNKQLFNNLLVPIPPFGEQQRIIEKLYEILPIVEKINSETN